MQQPQPTLPFAPAIGFARNRETAPAYWQAPVVNTSFTALRGWVRRTTAVG